MTVSNSTDFSLTASQMVSAALAELGVLAEEEGALDAVQLNRGLQYLNAMLKAWEAAGVMVWTLTEGSFDLTQGTASYTFGSGGAFATVPMDIDQMRIYRGSNDLLMTRIGRQDYFMFPNKTVQGYPTQWYYDRQRDTGVLYVWPTADSTLGTLKFTYRRRIMDVDAGTDTFDLPQEWHEAIRLNLARRLINAYGKAGTPRAAQIMQDAESAYTMVKNYDIGEGMTSVFIIPDRTARPRY